MPTQTTGLGLTVYDDTDKQVTFKDYRDKTSGKTDSNTTKIEDAIVALETDKADIRTDLDLVIEQSNEIASDVTNHKSEPIYKMISVTESALQTTSTTINLGFKPKLVQIHAEIMGFKYYSYGTSDGVNQYSKYTRSVPSENTTIQLSAGTIMFDEGTGANRVRGDVRFTDNGIVIDWTSTGTLPNVVPAVTRRYFITAFRHGGI